MKTAEINKALEYLKSKHNGELPYTFGTQEIGRWMAEYAEQVAKEAWHEAGELEARGLKWQDFEEYWESVTTK